MTGPLTYPPEIVVESTIELSPEYVCPDMKAWVLSFTVT